MISDLKDLERLFKLCRKQGVTDIKMQGVEIRFGDLPTSKEVASAQAETEPDPMDPFQGMTEEEIDKIVFYSAPKIPGEAAG